MRWGVADFKYNVFFDGVERDPDFVADVTADIKDLDEVVERVRASAYEWRILPCEPLDAAAESYSDFYDFMRACSALQLRYVFVFNGAIMFHFMDVARLWTHSGRWETITAERDENGLYKGRNKEAFTERSGPNGERYSVTYWTRSPVRSGNRHNRLRPTTFINLDNILTAGEDAAANAFLRDGREGLERVRDIVKSFDDLIRNNGDEWIGKKRVNGETVGALAKRFLLSQVGGKNSVKKASELTPAQYAYLRRGKIMRGGICLCANTHDQIVRGLYVYDVNSLYPYISAHMDELHNPRACSWEAYQNDEKLEYAYIITLDDLEVRLKPGRIPVLKGREGACIYGGVCATPGGRMSFFSEEFEEMTEYYDMTHMHVHSVVKLDRVKNPGYKEFAETWFSKKSKAKKEKDGGMLMLCKMILNSALGKLSQKSVYDIVTHEAYKPINGYVHAVTRNATEEEEQAETGALSPIQGAYVTALARVHMMRILREGWGGTMPQSFIYMDTDSLHMRNPAPAEFIGEGLGQLKEECVDGIGKYVGLKCYAFTDGERAEAHIAGARREDYYKTVADQFGEVTPQSIVVCMSPGAEIQARVNIIVPYGRAYVERTHTISAIEHSATIHTFGKGKSALFEL